MADPATGTDPQAVFTYIGYAVGAIIAAVVARLGWNSGKKTVEKPEELVEIRSAIVDTKAIDRLTASVEALGMSMIAGKIEAKKVEDIADRAVKAIEALADEVRNLSRETRELAREITNK
jgi:hypothetical protein